MRKKRRSKSIDYFIRNVVMFLILFGIFLVVLRIGIFGGQKIYQLNKRLVGQTDVGFFKAVLNEAVQIIDLCYNSGKTSVSLSEEIRSLVDNVFSIDSRQPSTILSSQFGFMRVPASDSTGRTANTTGTSGEDKSKSGGGLSVGRANPGESGNPGGNGDFEGNRYSQGGSAQGGNGYLGENGNTPGNSERNSYSRGTTNPGGSGNPGESGNSGGNGNPAVTSAPGSTGEPSQNAQTGDSQSGSTSPADIRPGQGTPVPSGEPGSSSNMSAQPSPQSGSQPLPGSTPDIEFGTIMVETGEYTPNPVATQVLFKNESKFKIDTDELEKEPLNLKLDQKGPKVLIYHTHTTESYIRSIEDLKNPDVSAWTEDPRYNVVRVGEEIAMYLRKNYGIEVIHNGTIHDKGSYDGSYSRSLETVTSILKSYPSIQIVLDIHRDALTDKRLRILSNVGNKPAAPLMFVVGTDQNGQYHPNWHENLKLAMRLQSRLNAYYPSLTRPINIRSGRFNQHVAPGALLVEVGGDGNTLDEALVSARYLARVLGEIIQEQSPAR